MCFVVVSVVTFGEWVVLLRDLEVQSPKCTIGKDCGNWGAGLYLMTYIMLTTFVVTNLIIAVIMNSFTWLYAIEKDRGKNAVTAADLRQFKVLQLCSLLLSCHFISVLTLLSLFFGCPPLASHAVYVGSMADI